MKNYFHFGKNSEQINLPQGIYFCVVTPLFDGEIMHDAEQLTIFLTKN